MRKTLKKLLSLTIVLTLLLAGCGGTILPQVTNPGGDMALTPEVSEDNAPASVTVEFSASDGEMFTQRDQQTDYDPEKAVTICLEGTSAEVSSDSVRQEGSTVILREEGTYVISGSFSGMLLVDAPDTAKLQLVLKGVDITSETSAALYILEADKVFVTLEPGTENYLRNGGSFTAIDENNIDGAVFSKQDLTFNGSGALTVISPAGHGIVCKDDLVITGGSYTVNSASHGLDANDSVRITSATVSIDAGKDAIHCENSDDAQKGFVYLSGGSILAEAEGDGISAGSYLQMAGGTVELLVGGGSENGSKPQSEGFGGFMGGGRPGRKPSEEGFGNGVSTEESSTSMKGLKAVSGMLISGGEITVNSADDAIHCDQSITLCGGNFLLSSGDDAIHAEDTLTVTDGNIRITESYEGLEALHIAILGGDIMLKASDDGLNAAGGTDQSGIQGGRDGMFGGRPGGGFGGMSANSSGSILVSGGTLYIQSSGDGLDANGTLEISGGYTVVTGPNQGDTATLDYDVSGVITGGVFIGTGASGMAQTFSDSTQGVIALRVASREAGTQLLLTEDGGNVLLTHAPEMGFSVVIFSCPEMKKGENYTVVVGEDSGSFAAS